MINRQITYNTYNIVIDYNKRASGLIGVTLSRIIIDHVISVATHSLDVHRYH